MDDVGFSQKVPKKRKSDLRAQQGKPSREKRHGIHATSHGEGRVLYEYEGGRPQFEEKKNAATIGGSKSVFFVKESDH